MPDKTSGLIESKLFDTLMVGKKKESFLTKLILKTSTDVKKGIQIYQACRVLSAIPTELATSPQLKKDNFREVAEVVARF